MPYFDHNATSPFVPAARAAWLRASEEAWANPSSPYRISARVHRALGEAREQIAAHLGVDPEEVVFTSGATEGNNAVIRWISDVMPAGAVALVSPLEHPSVLEPARAIFGPRLRVDAAPADAWAGAVDRPIAFVAAMAANNETGQLRETPALDALCRDRGAWYLCDAVQWIGRLPASGLAPHAFVVGCAHKSGGPKGVGFLRVPRHALDAGFRGQRGGEQERARRAGTENFPAIAGMVAALDAAAAEFATIETRARWRKHFIGEISRRIPGCAVNTGDAPCLWNTVSLRMPAHENTRWVVRLDKLGFEVSTGSACASGSTKPSHVLATMGLTPEEARRTIRISSGWETTERDWQLLADALVNVWEQLELDTMGETGGAIRL